jgi:hypothetical protein
MPPFSSSPLFYVSVIGGAKNYQPRMDPRLCCSVEPKTSTPTTPPSTSWMWLLQHGHRDSRRHPLAQSSPVDSTRISMWPLVDQQPRIGKPCSTILQWSTVLIRVNGLTIILHPRDHHHHQSRQTSGSLLALPVVLWPFWWW